MNKLEKKIMNALNNDNLFNDISSVILNDDILRIKFKDKQEEGIHCLSAQYVLPITIKIKQIIANHKANKLKNLIKEFNDVTGDNYVSCLDDSDKMYFLYKNGGYFEGCYGTISKKEHKSKIREMIKEAKQKNDDDNIQKSYDTIVGDMFDPIDTLVKKIKYMYQGNFQLVKVSDVDQYLFIINGNSLDAKCLSKHEMIIYLKDYIGLDECDIKEEKYVEPSISDLMDKLNSVSGLCYTYTLNDKCNEYTLEESNNYPFTTMGHETLFIEYLKSKIQHYESKQEITQDQKDDVIVEFLKDMGFICTQVLSEHKERFLSLMEKAKKR